MGVERVERQRKLGDETIVGDRMLDDAEVAGDLRGEGVSKDIF